MNKNVVERKVAESLGFREGVIYLEKPTYAYAEAVEILGPVIVLSEEIRDGNAYRGNLTGGVEVLRRKLDAAKTKWATYVQRGGCDGPYEDRIAGRMAQAFSIADAQLTAFQRAVNRADERTRSASYRL